MKILKINSENFLERSMVFYLVLMNTTLYGMIIYATTFQDNMIVYDWQLLIWILTFLILLFYKE